MLKKGTLFNNVSYISFQINRQCTEKLSISPDDLSFYEEGFFKTSSNGATRVTSTASTARMTEMLSTAPDVD